MAGTLYLIPTPLGYQSNRSGTGFDVWRGETSLKQILQRQADKGARNGRGGVTQRQG